MPTEYSALKSPPMVMGAFRDLLTARIIKPISRVGAPHVLSDTNVDFPAYGRSSNTHQYSPNLNFENLFRISGCHTDIWDCPGALRRRHTRQNRISVQFEEKTYEKHCGPALRR